MIPPLVVYYSLVIRRSTPQIGVAVLMNGLMALKAIATLLPEQVFEQHQAETSRQEIEVGGHIASKLLIQPKSTIIKEQRSGIKPQNMENDDREKKQTHENKPRDSKAFQRTDHQATTVGSVSERSLQEDKMQEVGHLGKRFPIQKSNQTSKNPRKFSLDTINNEISDLEGSPYRDDIMVNSAGSQDRKLKKSSASHWMIQELSAHNCASRLTQLSYDNQTNQAKREGDYPLTSEYGGGLTYTKEEIGDQPGEDLHLSRSTSSISISTLNINDMHENTTREVKHIVHQYQQQKTNDFHGLCSEKVFGHQDTSERQNLVNQQDDFDQNRSPVSSLLTLSEQNHLLESLLESMERSGDSPNRPGLLADDLKLFQISSTTDPTYHKKLEAAANRYAELFSGKFIPVKVRFMNTFTFKCCLGHKFDLVSSQIAENAWCEKCSELWQSLQKTAKKRDSIVMDKTISPQVNIRCMRNHLFTLKPSE